MGVEARKRACDVEIVVAAPGPNVELAARTQRDELVGTRYVRFEGTEDGAARALEDADVLLFIARAGDAVDAASAARAAEAARARGIVVVALVVAEGEHADPSLLTTLRDVSDMVMFVREPNAIHGILAALR